jgi:hypothetical protein
VCERPRVEIADRTSIGRNSKPDVQARALTTRPVRGA